MLELKKSGIADSLLDGIEQASDAEPIHAEGLQNYLMQTLGSRRAKKLMQKHMATIYRTCALSSLITIDEWDPESVFHENQTIVNAYHCWNRAYFKEELVQLLNANIEHSVSESNDYFKKTAASVDSGSSNCFIATAASGDTNDPSVVTLRRFRDQRLAMTPLGRFFMLLYEVFGPIIARMIRPNRMMCAISYAICIRPCAQLVSTMLDSKNEKKKQKEYNGS